MPELKWNLEKYFQFVEYATILLRKIAIYILFQTQH